MEEVAKYPSLTHGHECRICLVPRAGAVLATMMIGEYCVQSGVVPWRDVGSGSAPLEDLDKRCFVMSLFMRALRKAGFWRG
jgi:hypothetical protein